MVVGSSPTGPAKSCQRKKNVIETKRKSDFQEILTVAIIIFACFFAFTYFLAVVLGPAIFFFTSEGVAVSVMHVNGLPVLIGVRNLFYIPVTPNVGAVFMFLVGVFLLCLLAAWKFRESFHYVIGKGSSRPVGKLFNNFLLAMPIITNMLFVAVLAIINLQSLIGVPTAPSFETENLNPFKLFFIINYDVLMEEIGFRIIPIGFFLIIYVFESQVRNGIALSAKERLKLFFTTFLVPDRAKKTVSLKTVSEFGIRKGICRSEWIMIFITAFAWGLAHFLVGGWTVGKITSVFVDGLVFGLVYLVYGAYAPILLHWFFNYYTWVLFDESAVTYYPYLLPISFLVVLLMLGIGIVGWIAFAIIGVKKLLTLRAKPTEQLSLPPPPDQTSITVGET